MTATRELESQIVPLGGDRYVVRVKPREAELPFDIQLVVDPEGDGAALRPASPADAGTDRGVRRDARRRSRSSTLKIEFADAHPSTPAWCDDGATANPAQPSAGADGGALRRRRDGSDVA